MSSRIARVALFSLLLPLGCLPNGSKWKVLGGPQECMRMCAGWGLEFAGMVGVGNQEAWGEGATACVCQVRGAPKVSSEAAATAAALAAPIAIAAEEEERRKKSQADDAEEEQKRKQAEDQKPK